MTRWMVDVLDAPVPDWLVMVVVAALVFELGFTIGLVLQIVELGMCL